jgi:hypothetical protein
MRNPYLPERSIRSEQCFEISKGKTLLATPNEWIVDPAQWLLLISVRVHLHYEIPQSIIGAYLVDYTNTITVTECSNDHPIGACSHICWRIRISDNATRGRRCVSLKASGGLSDKGDA